MAIVRQFIEHKVSLFLVFQESFDLLEFDELVHILKRHFGVILHSSEVHHFVHVI